MAVVDVKCQNRMAQESRLSVEQLMERENFQPELHALVNCSDYFSCLTKADPLIVNYVVKNFDQILHFVFEQSVRETREVTFALKILAASNPDLKNALIKNTKFVNYIIEYPKTIKIYHPPSVTRYFQYLPAFISDNNSEISHLFLNRDFFESIIQVCDIYEALMFMKSVFNSRGVSIEIFLSQINIASIIATYITDNSTLSMHCIMLFKTLMERYVRQCSTAIIHNNMIPRMIDLSLKENYHHLAEFVSYLYQESYRYPNESTWRTIQFLVDDRIPEICDFIITRTKFEPISKALCEIIIIYLDEQRQFFPKAAIMTEKLTNDVFTHQTNSFLHNIVLRLYEILTIFPAPFTELISRTDICRKIVEYNKKQDKARNTCIWGFLWQASLLIKTPINVTKKDWDAIIARNKAMNTLISMPLPNVVLNRNGRMHNNQFSISSSAQKINIINVFAVLFILIAGVLIYANNK